MKFRLWRLKIDLCARASAPNLFEKGLKQPFKREIPSKNDVLGAVFAVYGYDREGYKLP